MLEQIQFYKRKHNANPWNLTFESPICMDKHLKIDIFVQTQIIMQKAEILSKLKYSKSELNKFGVTRIGLFGSVVKNLSNSESDVDILIDFRSDLETFENYMNTCSYLEEILKGCKLDIVTENGLSPYIGPYILKEVEYV
jgi:predicted nucleotidyltransferase